MAAILMDMSVKSRVIIHINASTRARAAPPGLQGPSRPHSRPAARRGRARARPVHRSFSCLCRCQSLSKISIRTSSKAAPRSKGPTCQGSCQSRGRTKAPSQGPASVHACTSASPASRGMAPSLLLSVSGRGGVPGGVSRSAASDGTRWRCGATEQKADPREKLMKAPANRWRRMRHQQQRRQQARGQGRGGRRLEPAPLPSFS
jgi:hypothetical protein